MKKNQCSILMLVLSLGTFLLHANSEDICYEEIKDENGEVTYQPYNCMDSLCDPSSPQYDPLHCRVGVTLQAGKAMENKGAHSIAHVESTNFIAQLLGFRWDAAYWIAMYDQAVDVSTYSPVFFDGSNYKYYGLDQTIVNASIRGWNRLCVGTGGNAYHFAVPYNPLGNKPPRMIDGSYPDLDDEEREGLVAQYRHWAEVVEGAQLPCIAGFTEREDGKVFFGPTCFQGIAEGQLQLLSFINQLEPKLVAFGGEMIVNYEFKEEGKVDICSEANRESVYYVSQMDTYMSLSKNRMDSDKNRIIDEHDLEPVPSTLAKLGIYLHILQDRISHSMECGNQSWVYYDENEHKYKYHYDDTNCSFDWHSWRHFEEQGTELPARMYSALSYTMRELWLFHKRHQNSGWFEKKPLSDQAFEQLRRDYVGDRFHPGKLAKAIMENQAVGRLSAIEKLLLENQLHPLNPKIKKLNKHQIADMRKTSK